MSLKEGTVEPVMTAPHHEQIGSLISFANKFYLGSQILWGTNAKCPHTMEPCAQLCVGVLGIVTILASALFKNTNLSFFLFCVILAPISPPT